MPNGIDGDAAAPATTSAPAFASPRGGAPSDGDGHRAEQRARQRAERTAINY